MKDIRVDGIFQRVFVLSEAQGDNGKTRIVYIPIKALHRTDYDRLLLIEKTAGRRPMLEEMKKTTLDNGKNALALYDSLIQVVEMNDNIRGTRLQKPDEKPRDPAVAVVSSPSKEAEAETPVKRKPGRPPGSKNKPKTEESTD